MYNHPQVDSLTEGLVHPPPGSIQLIGSLVRLACVYVHRVLTVLALHSAAPLKLALALGDALDTHGVVTAAATHDLTAVWASGRLVTLATRCAQRTCCRGGKQMAVF